MIAEEIHACDLITASFRIVQRDRQAPEKKRSGLVVDQQSDGYAIVLTVDNDCFLVCLFVCLFIYLFVAYHLE